MAASGSSCRALDTQVQDLRRSPSHQEFVDAVRPVALRLAGLEQEEMSRLQRVLTSILEAGRPIPLDRDVLV